MPKLIQVESFDHVHQLVTTVVGELGKGVGAFEAIGRCFPPGSSGSGALMIQLPAIQSDAQPVPLQGR